MKHPFYTIPERAYFAYRGLEPFSYYDTIWIGSGYCITLYLRRRSPAVDTMWWFLTGRRPR